jgi:putative IMPACT (imprinted ancient) family translation regulator
MELAQDMISVRIGPDVKNTVVGSADYFSGILFPTRLMNSVSTSVSGCGHQPMVVCMTGNLRMASVPSMSGSSAR